VPDAHSDVAVSRPRHPVKDASSRGAGLFFIEHACDGYGAIERRRRRRANYDQTSRFLGRLGGV